MKKHIEYSNWKNIERGNALHSLEKIAEFNSLNLPSISKTNLAILNNSDTIVLDGKDLKTLLKVEGESVINIYGGYLFTYKNGNNKHVYKINISTGERVWEDADFFLSGMNFGQFQYTKPQENGMIKKFDLITNNIHWEFKTEDKTQSITSATGKMVFIEDGYHKCKICLDANSGEKIWEFTAADFPELLKISGKESKTGNNFIVDNILIGCDLRTKVYHGININTLKMEWVLEVPNYHNRHMGYDKNGYFFIVEKELTSLKCMVIDLEKGVVKKKIEIGALIMEFKDRFLNLDQNWQVGAVCIDDESIYLGIKNLFFQVNKTHHKVHLLYDNKKNLGYINSSIAHNKLFVIDGGVNTCVFA